MLALLKAFDRIISEDIWPWTFGFCDNFYDSFNLIGCVLSVYIFYFFLAKSWNVVII